jgi:hypothetical protein
MGNNQSISQYEKLIEKPTPQKIKYSYILFNTDGFVIKFMFSLNNINFVFKLFINSKVRKYHYDCSEFEGIFSQNN